MAHPTKAEIFQKESWVGGPTHVFQKQHIPGYQGHVPSLNAEGLYSKSFAKLTSNCLENRVDKGFIIDENQRFGTTNRKEFAKPDLRKNQLSKTAEQVLQEFNARNHIMKETIKKIQEKGPKTIDDIPPIDRVPVIGYMGFKPVFKHPLRKVKKNNYEEVKDNTKFENLSQGFQLQLLQDEKLRQEIQPLDCPIVGYTGFVPSIKSDNRYGRNYHDTAYGCLQEKVILK